MFTWFSESKPLSFFFAIMSLAGIMDQIIEWREWFVNFASIWFDLREFIFDEFLFWLPEFLPEWIIEYLIIGFIVGKASLFGERNERVTRVGRVRKIPREVEYVEEIRRTEPYFFGLFESEKSEKVRKTRIEMDEEHYTEELKLNLDEATIAMRLVFAAFIWPIYVINCAARSAFDKYQEGSDENSINQNIILSGKRCVMDFILKLALVYIVFLFCASKVFF